MYALWVHARDINNQAQADAVIARARSAGITDILFQVLDDSGRAHYNTTLFTRCPDIGTFDPLRYLSSATGIGTHAWLCVGTDLLYYRQAWSAVRTRNLGSKFPHWSDFTLADCRQFAADWCASIVKAYPGVGIHLDYMRWHTDYGDAKLQFATATPITQTVQQIRAAIPSAMLSAAVNSDPTGTMFGSMQAWGSWTAIVNMFAIMAYPLNVSQLQTMMARSSAYNKDQIAIGLSGLYFQYNPYRETRLTPAALIEMMTWAKNSGYKHFAWFDLTKIDPQQYAVVAQFAPHEIDVIALVKGLTKVAGDLRAQVGRLRTEATALEMRAADLEAIVKEVSA